MGVNLLNGGIILALMSVPIIVSVGEDALKAVPDSYREAALSLGASRWEIVYRVLFPAAKNGLLAAVLLGVGRAIGETMAVLMCTGHSVQMPHSLLDPVRTLTATIASELGECVAGSTHYRVLFVIGLELFAITFVVNLAADLVVKGIRNERCEPGRTQVPLSQRGRGVSCQIPCSSPLEKRKKIEGIDRPVRLGAITLMLVVPVVAIFGYLLFKAWPVLGLSFILQNPKDYMTAGGIWAPWSARSSWC